MRATQRVIFRPIGIIHSPFQRALGTPIQPVFAEKTEGRVDLFPEFIPGLDDLEGFERIWLLYWFDRVGEVRLRITPYRDKSPRGLFATRAPARPNPIGLSCVRLLRRQEEGTLVVAGIDVLDGTPLLDIKPYVPEFDAFPSSRAGWHDAATDRRTEADDRFHRSKS